MNPKYWGRPVIIHCCKDGTITYRRVGQPTFNGAALPVYSVKTEEEAKALQIILCRFQYQEHPLMPGQNWYVLNEFSGEVEDLERVGDKMDKVYDMMRQRMEKVDTTS